MEEVFLPSPPLKKIRCKRIGILLFFPPFRPTAWHEEGGKVND